MWCPLQILIRLNKYTRPFVKNCYDFFVQCSSISSQLPPQTPQRCWLRSHNTILQRCCFTSHSTRLHNLLIPTAALSIDYELEHDSCSLPRRCMGKRQVSLVWVRSGNGPATWIVCNQGGETKWSRHLVFHQKFYRKDSSKELL